MLILSHTVTPGEAGRRLRDILQRALRLSTHACRQLKVTGGVFVDGRASHQNQRMDAGAQIRVELPPAPEEPPDAPIEHIPLSVPYEDEALLCAVKPQGMLTHPSRNQYHNTLMGAVLGYLTQKEQPLYAHPIHRLDRDTSGLLLFSRHPHAQAHLMSQMALGEFHKTYFALVSGSPPEPAGMVDLPIARDPDSRLLRRAAPDGQAALSSYRVLDTLQAEGRAVSLLMLTPHTGRTHQLRIHCLALGTPILGDVQYFTPESQALSDRLGLTGQSLHAGALCCTHPITGERFPLYAPPPASFYWPGMATAQSRRLSEICWDSLPSSMR